MKNFLNHFEEYMIAILLGAIALLESFNAITNIFKLSIIGAPEEIAKFLYVYICFFSFSYCEKACCNVSVRMISDKYGIQIQPVLTLIRNAINFFIALSLLIGSISYELNAFSTGASGKVTGIPYYFVGFGAVLGTAMCLMHCIKSLMSAKKGASVKC